MPSPDEIRDAQRATWAGLSAGWEKWDSVIMDQLGPVGAAMIERLDIAHDHQHLDVASGTGEPGLSIARLSPKGRVVLTDLSAEMLEVASCRARSQGIANVETKVCSADALPFDDGTFDSVSVRFGYMFFLPGKATAEFARLLSRADASRLVWIRGRENPLTTNPVQGGRRDRRWLRHPTRRTDMFRALPRGRRACTAARGCVTSRVGRPSSS